MKEHRYRVQMKWTGNLGTGTSGYGAYSRNHIHVAEGKPELPGSSDPSFLGDSTRYNPEELLVASLSSCHMLWYLHLCATNRIIVEKYEDFPEGIMVEEDGGGRFTEVILKPQVTIQSGCDPYLAAQLHHEANRLCFIANSCNFPVRHEPRTNFN